MSLWDELRYRARRLRPGRTEAELDEEIRTHLELETEEKIAAGLPPDEARRAARRRFGNVALTKEDTRAMWGLGIVGILWSDLKHGARVLRRRPGFAATAVLSLALGIGASTAMFSVVDGVLLRSLPYPDPDRIVELREVSDRGTLMAVAEPNFLDVRARARGFDGLAEHNGNYIVSTVTGGIEPVRAVTEFVSSDFFRVLGVTPALGRSFLPEESRAGGAFVAVVGYGFWQRSLGGRTDLSTVTLTIEDHAYAVVGVMPPGFAYPARAEIWLPREVLPADGSRTAHNWSVIGRLRAGVTLERARADATTIARQLAREHAGDDDAVDVALVPLADYLVGGVRHTLLVLLGSVGLLLLIACANVANLMLAQATARGRELALRAALGATRARLAVQFVAEGLVIALMAAALGVPLSVAGVDLLVGLHRENLPRAGEIGVDARALGFALAVAVVVSVGLGLVTALRGVRRNVHAGLVEAGRSDIPSAARSRLRRVLVVAQVALTFVLLAGAGLLARSFARLLAVDPGFRPETAVAMDVSLSAPADEAGQRRVARFYQELIDRLSAIPGVSAAGAVTAMPLTDSGGNGTFLVDEDFAKQGDADYRLASDGYFAAMGIPLLRGRRFAAGDTRDSPHVALISQSLASRYWPDQDPIGRTLQFGNMDDDLHPFHIIGIVGDVRDRGLDAQARPTVYALFRQRPQRDLSFVVRAERDPAALVPAMRADLQALDPALPAQFRTLEQIVSSSLDSRRFSLLLLATFASVALLLAITGIYGVIAYSVARRTREIGVRVALGARPRAVVAMVVAQGAAMALVGVAIGLAAALALARLLAGALYGVRATDPVTFALVAVAVIGATLGACYVPARRAARVDPMVALRAE
ncbi:MAG TPA: ABC transporter permease [Haliangiales bacterium]|nr:ABC transporter permease [Haliangiales bacterium]